MEVKGLTSVGPFFIEKEKNMIFDTHTHLNVKGLKEEARVIVENARKLGVHQMAVVGFDFETIEMALEQVGLFEGVYAIVGWHPTEAASYTDEVEEYLKDKLQQEKVVAVGEMGLDYHWDTAPHEVQKDVFRKQIRLAKSVNLPITVHNRESTEDVYQILKEEDVRDIGGIMHSFNLDPSWAEKFLDLGMHLSYNGIMTFKNAEEVRESARMTPKDRLLVETDAPYLAPVPKRGKRNEPAYVRYVVECLAEVRGTSFEEMAELTSRNARSLFNL